MDKGLIEKAFDTALSDAVKHKGCGCFVITKEMFDNPSDIMDLFEEKKDILFENKCGVSVISEGTMAPKVIITYQGK